MFFNVKMWKWEAKTQKIERTFCVKKTAKIGGTTVAPFPLKKHLKHIGYITCVQRLNETPPLVLTKSSAQRCPKNPPRQRLLINSMGFFCYVKGPRGLLLAGAKD